MNCKKLIALSLMLCIGFWGKAQELRYANFIIEDYKKGIQGIVLTFDSFILGISPEGKVSFIEPLKRGQTDSWGDYEDNPVQGSKNLGNLKVIYYDYFDSDKSGKIKSIDGISMDYYTSFDIHDKKGRLKSIGKMAIKYNNGFDIHDVNGSLKSIGDVKIKYNNGFNIHETSGTVKSIGSVQVSWYNAFDDEKRRGKIKSIKGNTRALYVTRRVEDNNWSRQ